MPTLPYPFVGGDNSPPISTHSPPSAIAMTNLNGNRIALSGRDSRDPIDYMSSPTVVRPQPQLPSSAATIAVAGHLTNNNTSNELDPNAAVIRPNHLDELLKNQIHTTTTLSPLRIRVSSPNRINSDLTSVSIIQSTHFFKSIFFRN